MLQLEALACLAAFVLVLAFFFHAGQSLQASARESLALFEARLLAESQAFYVDMLYNNSASPSLARSFTCREEKGLVACRAGVRQAFARLENDPGILADGSRVKGNGHYR